MTDREDGTGKPADKAQCAHDHPETDPPEPDHPQAGEPGYQTAVAFLRRRLSEHVLLEVARVAGCSYTTVHRIATGKTLNIYTDTAIRLHAAVDWIESGGRKGQAFVGRAPGDAADAHDTGDAEE